MNFYRFRFGGLGLPVVFPKLRKNMFWRWRRLYGVQLGSWFVGAVQGSKDPETKADTALATQIVRLLDAIGNRYDPLAYSEPLVKAAHDRYSELRECGRGFEDCSRISRAEAVAGLIARGTPLVEPAPAPEEVPT